MGYLFKKTGALEELKKSSKKKTLARIIISCNNKSENDIKLTLSSINNQSFDNIEVLLVG